MSLVSRETGSADDIARQPREGIPGSGEDDFNVIHRFSAAWRPGARGSASSSGQALVEFALVIGLVVILILGVVDLARLVATYSAAVTASREAARFGTALGDSGAGVPQYVDCAGIRQAARAVTSGLLTLPDDRIRISYDNGSGTARSKACPPHGLGPSASEIARLDRIVVEVTVTFQAVSPAGLLFDPVTIVTTNRRAIVKAP